MTSFSLSPQEDEWYEQSSDARSQLKFFEQLERMEKQRKDEREREILLRAAKVNAGEAQRVFDALQTGQIHALDLKSVNIMSKYYVKLVQFVLSTISYIYIYIYIS